MKKRYFIIAIFAIAFVQIGLAHDSTNSQTSYLLHSYFDIKNALIAGNSNTASINAGEFVKTFNGIDPKNSNEAIRNILLKEAGQISGTNNIRRQREYFATFSTNMYALAKAFKFSADPVYYTYCPMKKAYWLSSEAAIKNPYYGNMMLTCGKVTETLK